MELLAPRDVRNLPSKEWHRTNSEWKASLCLLPDVTSVKNWLHHLRLLNSVIDLGAGVPCGNKCKDFLLNKEENAARKH